MSCRRPGEAWSLPAVAAPALAFWARRRGVGNAAVGKEFFKSGHRFHQQGVGFSVGGIRLCAQPLIGSPMHSPRLLRQRFQRVVAPAKPHLDLLCSAYCAPYGNLLLARVGQPQAVLTGEQVAYPVKLCSTPATKFPVSRDNAIEPGSFTAEVAFCPVDGDSLKEIFRFRGAVRENTGDQHDGGRLALDDNNLIIQLEKGPQSWSQQVPPLQLTDIDSLKVLANGVLRSSAHIEIIWQNEACSKDLCVLSWRVFNG
jgi:hypothetical protein